MSSISSVIETELAYLARLQ